MEQNKRLVLGTGTEAHQKHWKKGKEKTQSDRGQGWHDNTTEERIIEGYCSWRDTVWRSALLYSKRCKIAGEQPKPESTWPLRRWKQDKMSKVFPLSQVFMSLPSCAHCYTGIPHFIVVCVKEAFLCLTKNGVLLKTQMCVIGKSGGWLWD